MLRCAEVFVPLLRCTEVFVPLLAGAELGAVPLLVVGVRTGRSSALAGV